MPQTASSPVDHCATTFHNVRLPFDALLQGDHGRLTPDGEFTSALGSPRRRFLQSIGRVTMGKLCMTAHSLGVMRHALDVAMRYAHTRVTSGMTNGQRVPLIAHRGHHTPCSTPPRRPTPPRCSSGRSCVSGTGRPARNARRTSG